MNTVELFSAALTGAFAPTKPLLISGQRLTLDFEFSTVGTVEWYLEFASDDPLAAATIWYREVAEEDVGSGITHMPPVVRDFVLSAADLNRTAQFIREHRFVRVQMRLAAGSDVHARVLAPFGLTPQAP